MFLDPMTTRLLEIFNAQSLPGASEEAMRVLKVGKPATRVKVDDGEGQQAGYDNPGMHGGAFVPTIARDELAPGNMTPAEREAFTFRLGRDGEDAQRRAEMRARQNSIGAVLTAPGGAEAANAREQMIRGEGLRAADQARRALVAPFEMGKEAYEADTKRQTAQVAEYGAKVTEPAREQAAMERERLKAETEMEKARLGGKIARIAPLEAEQVKATSEGNLEKASFIGRKIAEMKAEEEGIRRPQPKVTVKGGGDLKIRPGGQPQDKPDGEAPPPLTDKQKLARDEADVRRMRAMDRIRAAIGYPAQPGGAPGKFDAETFIKAIDENSAALDDASRERIRADLAAGVGGTSAAQIQQALFKSLQRRAASLPGGAADKVFGGLRFHRRLGGLADTYAVTDPETRKTLMARDVYGFPALQGYADILPRVAGGYDEQYRRELELTAPMLRKLLTGGQP